MEVYPYKFGPIYVEKIWGGRALERLFGRPLPHAKNIGESWELADLAGATSVVTNGPHAGQSLTALTRGLGAALLGRARPTDDGRFPLLLKFLDANDVLSLQVHPDARAVQAIGGDAALKTECWYVIESRRGYIYKGVRPGVKAAQFRKAIENDRPEHMLSRFDVAAGDFHYLPAGTAHALGAGVVVAEVQTPSDTTYRVTDWGRGREIHVERSIQCIHFEPADDQVPGAAGQTLLVTEFFAVARRSADAGADPALPKGRCTALMILAADRPVVIRHAGAIEPAVTAGPGDTVLLPADLDTPSLEASAPATWLEITLPLR